MPEETLYIKRIKPDQYRLERKSGGGGKQLIKRVDSTLREALTSQLEAIETEFQKAPPESPFVPARVLLEEKALAKSHWPYALFSDRRAPIIGAGAPGELFVQLGRGSLKLLMRQVMTAQSDNLKKAISAIREISPLDRTYRLGAESPEKILAAAPKSKNMDSVLIEVELFRYFGADEDRGKREAFFRLMAERGLKAKETTLPADDRTMVVECIAEDDVLFLAEQVMVQQVHYMPCYLPIFVQSFNRSVLPLDLNIGLPNPKDCPVVATADTGIDSGNPQIQPWIAGRDSYVPPAYLDPEHGTFVAGLLIWGDRLNKDVPGLESLPCRVLDIPLLPAKADENGVPPKCTEEELFEALEEAIEKHHKEVKVWNLSLTSTSPIRLDRFSNGAVALDELQEKYGVSIVIAAGNYARRPQLPYPRSDQEKESGRITAPGDTVLGITVGGLAHCELSNGVRVGEPSPFSRNGPGPNYIIKPDLAHFAGNTQTNGGKRKVGISSVAPGNYQAEDIGTSFSTPLVARQLAYIYETITPTPSPTLARAILTHTARDMRTEGATGRVPDEDDHYMGFGTPVRIDRAIECEPWMMTMVFEETLRPGGKLIWDDFPYPECLISSEGKFTGEIWMTLAYPPKRGQQWGSEYCETHVDAHFGVVKAKDGGGEEFAGKVPLEHANKGELYEHFQVQRLRKWAPVRTYYARMPKGVSGYRWRLYVDMIARHGVDHEQPFVLLLTIADPEQWRPVYDQMTVNLSQRLQSQNLNIRAQIRNQIR